MARRAFTLIELLTVMAIIGVLAAILIPTTRMVIIKVRIAAAHNDIKSLETAILAYMAVYDAPPPDSNAFAFRTTTQPFQNMDTPNECLVWFLTREFVTDTDSALVAGIPWDGSDDGWGTYAPEKAAKVHARTAFTGTLDLTGKKRRDYDGDGFYEMVDPWGRPYQYRAYPKLRIASIGNDGVARLAATCRAPGDPWPSPPSRPWYPWVTAGTSVTISGTTDNNGTHTVIVSDIDNNGRYYFDFSSGSTTAENPAPRTAAVQIAPLHNPQKGFDLYSLGPNGRTRGASEGVDITGDSKVDLRFVNPYGAAQTFMVWGTAADGNDVAADQGGNAGITNDKDRDDICNWAK